MKRAVKTLEIFLTENHRQQPEQKQKQNLEKAPKAALLACPQLLRLLTVDRSAVYTVESFGATLMTNEASLDYALRRLELPLLLILGHAHCDALQRALRGGPATDEEQALYAYIAAGFTEGEKKEPKRAFHHIDREVAAALSRYTDLVKAGKLAVAGLYCDETGNPFLTNYNGLKGKEALAYSLPELEEEFFMV